MNSHHVPPAPQGFADPEVHPGALSAAAAASILGAVGDVTFILDRDGTILDMAVSDRDLARMGVSGWVGTRWAANVTIESVPKVGEMLADVDAGAPPRWRQVNHATPNGDVPVRYLAMALGQHGRIIAIGRDMRAAAATQQRLLQTQQSLERDYIRLRQAEARYRMLFDLAHEPVLIVDAATRRIREANAAAHRLLGVRDGALADQPASMLVDADQREALVAFFGAAEAAAAPAPLTAALRKGLGEARINATLFRQARIALLLVRIEPVESAAPVEAEPDRLRDVVERMPDAFVLADADMTILTANAAFVDLAEVASPERVTGAALDAWLGRPGIDLELIAAQLREHGMVRNVATVLCGSGGGEEEVEVSGVAVPGENGSGQFGFTIRTVGRRLREVADPGRDVPRSVEQLTDLVGRMSLKEIVRESTDLIERLCIEAALTYTSDNRASAAEILGVSRQSLYSKLHRHGLGSLVASDEA
ncbi:transcriptional regulator PpsR [Sphingomonas japonica]|uniref:Transcriptional regulator PpsR n=1 Tax=Sphingomonas japonica TaxID=511662 RepID=A0ABX0U1T7_9SPHN|nr:transcriptional regulator PpsR [Sphingomonas japonica]NIJ24474.1 transcriptional regulator PpsR [Sphingomonas japonica]